VIRHQEVIDTIADWPLLTECHRIGLAANGSKSLLGKNALGISED
jgi:hypothetical protein